MVKELMCARRAKAHVDVCAVVAEGGVREQSNRVVSWDYSHVL